MNFPHLCLKCLPYLFASLQLYLEITLKFQKLPKICLFVVFGKRGLLDILLHILNWCYVSLYHTITIPAMNLFLLHCYTNCCNKNFGNPRNGVAQEHRFSLKHTMYKTFTNDRYKNKRSFEASENTHNRKKHLFSHIFFYIIFKWFSLPYAICWFILQEQLGAKWKKKRLKNKHFLHNDLIFPVFKLNLPEIILISCSQKILRCSRISSLWHKIQI